MRSRLERALVFVAAAALLGLLGTALLSLQRSRYAAGDVYPAYSSLRADPVGTKALFDALGDLPDRPEGFAVRNRRPLAQLHGEPRTTLLVLGVPAFRRFELDDEDHEPDRTLSRPALEGARVVVTLAPVTRGAAVEPSATEDGSQPLDFDYVAPGLPAELGLAYLPLPESDEKSGAPGRPTPATARLSAAPDSAAAGHLLPATLPWHSGLVLAEPEAPWQVLYRREGRPVILERSLGRGSLVVATDSFFASNEGVEAQQRQPELLAYLLGDPEQVVFDETVHGVAEPRGVMVLARRYRLQGLFAGLFLLAGLYVWRASLPFAPLASAGRSGRRPGDAGPSGREATAGLVALLRRGIGASRLLEICVAAWRQSAQHRTPGDLVAAVERQAADATNPVSGYRIVHQLLESRKPARTETGLGRIDR